MFLNDDSWALQVVLTIIAMEVHCLQTTGAQLLLLQGLNEVLIKAENSEQVWRPPSISVSNGFGL